MKYSHWHGEIYIEKRRCHFISKHEYVHILYL